MSFFSDLFSGNFNAVEHDVTASVSKLPTWAQSLVTLLETDAGQLLSTAATTAAQDVIAGGLTTASFKAAVTDVGAKLTAQGKTLGTQVIYAAINAAVAETVAAAVPATPAVPTTPATPAA